MKNSTPSSSIVLSYLGLRKAIGIIGIGLPFVLILGKLILDGPGIEVSLSAYYYTVMRDVFVGSLCAIGVFLISYRGYELIDNIMGKLAAIFAIGAAFFPIQPVNADHHQKLIGNVHVIFSVSLLLTLAFFALVLFRKTDPTQPPTIQKLRRNIIYAVCGFGILVCLALGLLLRLFPSDSAVYTFSPLFWLESLAIILFGISWLVKGEAILKDEVNQRS